jgi:hypothetical protein
VFLSLLKTLRELYHFGSGWQIVCIIFYILNLYERVRCVIYGILPLSQNRVRSRFLKSQLFLTLIDYIYIISIIR